AACLEPVLGEGGKGFVEARLGPGPRFVLVRHPVAERRGQRGGAGRQPRGQSPPPVASTPPARVRRARYGGTCRPRPRLRARGRRRGRPTRPRGFRRPRRPRTRRTTTARSSTPRPPTAMVS